MVLNHFASALALVDALAAGGGHLVVREGRFKLTGSPSEELRARLRRFIEPASSDVDAETVVTRSMDGAHRGDACDIGPLAETIERARRQVDQYRALVAVVAAPSRAAREMLTLNVTFAVGLPVPFTVRFARRGDPHDGTRVECLTTSSRAVYDEAVKRGAPAFILREIVAMARAAAVGRATPQALDRWIAAKQADPRTVLEPAEIVGMPDQGDGGRTRDDTPLNVCFGELFDALGAELVDVDLHAPPGAA